MFLKVRLGFVGIYKENERAQSRTWPGTVEGRFTNTVRNPTAEDWFREYTERVETIKAGGDTLVGSNTNKILKTINYYLNNDIKIKNIRDYMSKTVSSKIIKILKF